MSCPSAPSVGIEHLVRLIPAAITEVDDAQFHFGSLGHFGSSAVTADALSMVLDEFSSLVTDLNLVRRLQDKDSPRVRILRPTDLICMENQHRSREFSVKECNRITLLTLHYDVCSALQVFYPLPTPLPDSPGAFIGFSRSLQHRRTAGKVLDAWKRKQKAISKAVSDISEECRRLMNLFNRLQQGPPHPVTSLAVAQPILGKKKEGKKGMGKIVVIGKSDVSSEIYPTTDSHVHSHSRTRSGAEIHGKGSAQPEELSQRPSPVISLVSAAQPSQQPQDRRIAALGQEACKHSRSSRKEDTSSGIYPYNAYTHPFESDMLSTKFTTGESIRKPGDVSQASVATSSTSAQLHPTTTLKATESRSSSRLSRPTGSQISLMPEDIRRWAGGQESVQQETGLGNESSTMSKASAAISSMFIPVAHNHTLNKVDQETSVACERSNSKLSRPTQLQTLQVRKPTGGRHSDAQSRAGGQRLGLQETGLGIGADSAPKASVAMSSMFPTATHDTAQNEVDSERLAACCRAGKCQRIIN